jgi:alpha-L-fucosidase
MNIKSPANENLYVATWTLLRKHHTPQWSMDTKFGICCHWGPSSVLYQKGNDNLSVDEAIEKFTVDKFDLEE